MEKRITGHTELVGLMAYPIRHTQSPTTHNLAYDKNGDDVIQLAFEVDNDSLKDAVQSIRALKMLGSNISMPNKTVVHKYLDEVDEAAKLCGAINTVVNMRDENGQVTGKLKGYNTDGMGYWQGLKEEGIDFKGMKMVLIGTGGAATAIAVRGALDGIAEMEIFNIKDKFYSRGEEIVDLINKNTNCKATMNDLADHDLLKEKMHAADLFCDATGVGMHPLEDLSNIPDTSFFKKDLIVTDTVYAPRETVMMKQAKEAGIPVISYDRLLMNSDAVTYYATFDNYKVGQKQGEYLVDALDLDNQDGPFNIELFTGDPGDNNCNFFFGGAMDVLQKYIDEGKLVVKSGQTEFEQVATANWDSAKAQDRMDTIIAGNYSDGTNLDAVLCSNDSTALGVENALAASYTGEYPIITGQDCDTPNVKNLVAGKQAMSVFKDTRALASAVVNMVDAIMKGEEPEINDTESYDNGTGVIPTYLCDPVVVTVDNYKEMLIDSGYYTEDQIK